MSAKILVGGALVAVGVCGVAYIAVQYAKKAPTDVYDSWDGYRAKSDQPVTNKTLTECKAQCNGDRKCTAFNYDTNEGTCQLSHDDAPRSNIEEKENSHMYIRLIEGENQSKWTDWDPAACPECTGATVAPVQKRTCLGGGNCIGPAERTCHLRTCYNKFENLKLSS